MGAGKVAKRIIGLMGNSGSGKSTAAAVLRELGADIIDADELSHDFCEPGQLGNKKIRMRFGNDFFREDGSLDRQKLGRYVFSRPEELLALEGILHPLVLAEVQARLLCSTAQTIVIDCALLTETGLDRLCSEIWLVEAGEKNRERIQERDGIDAHSAADRLKNQTPEKELEQYADHLLKNEGTVADLRKRVKELYDGQNGKTKK